MTTLKRRPIDNIGKGPLSYRHALKTKRIENLILKENPMN